MLKKIKYYLLLLVFVIFAFLFFTNITRAADPGIVCERQASKIVITIKLKYWQNNLTVGSGGNTELRSLIPTYNSHIEEVWNSGPNTTSCGLPVEFVVDGEMAAGNYPYIGPTEDDDVERNGNKCMTNHPGYSCIKITDNGIDGTAGYILTGDLFKKDTIKPHAGYWYADYFIQKIIPCPDNPSTSCFSGGPANRVSAHEVGHLMGLDDEYFIDRTANANVMGGARGRTYGVVEQKQIDTIVELNCQDANLVCTAAPPRTKCCAGDSNWQGGTPSWLDKYGTPNCQDSDVNECPGSDCGTSGTCESDCTCSGDTCSGTCEASACISLTPPQVPASGTCVSDPAKPNCCQVAPTRPPISPGGTAPPPTSSGTCDGIGCLPCFTTGNCTVCQMLDVAYELARFLLALVGALTLLFFIYGAFMVLLSAGIGEKIEQGKTIMKNAVLGLVIAFAAYLMITVTVWLITGQSEIFTSSLKCEPISRIYSNSNIVKIYKDLI